MRAARKLSLSRETLSRLDRLARGRDVPNPDFSCVESCYLVTCSPDCQVSTGAKGGD